MSSRDLESKVDFIQSLPPASRSTAANGASADLREFRSAMILISTGAIGGTTPSFTFEVQESDDNTTFAAVADGNLNGSEPVVTASDEVFKIGYHGFKRYVRVAITAVAGTSPTLLCEAGVLRGDPHVGPV